MARRSRSSNAFHARHPIRRLISGLLLLTATGPPRCKVRSRSTAMAGPGREPAGPAAVRPSRSRPRRSARRVPREQLAPALAHDGQPPLQLHRRHGRDDPCRALRGLPPDLVHRVLHVRRVGRAENQVPAAVVPGRILLPHRGDPLAAGLVLEHAFFDHPSIRLRCRLLEQRGERRVVHLLQLELRGIVPRSAQHGLPDRLGTAGSGRHEEGVQRAPGLAPDHHVPLLAARIDEFTHLRSFPLPLAQTASGRQARRSREKEECPMPPSLLDRLEEGISQILAFLPQLGMALGILLAGYAIARVIERGTDVFLHRIGFDRWMREGGVTEALERAGTNLDPSSVLAKFVYWIVILLAILLASNALGLYMISQLFTELLNYIPNVIAAVIILILGIMLGEFVKNLVLASAGAIRGVPILARAA